MLTRVVKLDGYMAKIKDSMQNDKKESKDEITEMIDNHKLAPEQFNGQTKPKTSVSADFGVADASWNPSNNLCDNSPYHKNVSYLKRFSY